MSMSLDDALRILAPFAKPHGFDSEPLRQRLALDSPKGTVVRIIGDAMVAGQLTALAFREATSSSAPDDFIVALGSLWDELVKVGLAECVDGFPELWTQETLRLWAYTGQWLITSEDEDLALMDEAFAPGLLAIAAEPQCPKREYILGIIRHWARDRAGAAAGREGFSELVARIAQHAVLAREANDIDLANYLQRLGSYAIPAPVDREGAHQRGLDLTGCAEPKPDEVKVERQPNCWTVTLPAPSPKTIRIALTDGRIY
jgi:hypothetical protein